MTKEERKIVNKRVKIFYLVGFLLVGIFVIFPILQHKYLTRNFVPINDRISWIKVSPEKLKEIKIVNLEKKIEIYENGITINTPRLAQREEYLSKQDLNSDFNKTRLRVLNSEKMTLEKSKKEIIDLKNQLENLKKQEA
jgi:hypothetical protein